MKLIFITYDALLPKLLSGELRVAVAAKLLDANT